MKINQIVTEAFKSYWNYRTVSALDPRKLAGLKQNATQANDQAVLAVISQVEYDRSQDAKRSGRPQMTAKPAASGSKITNMVDRLSEKVALNSPDEPYTVRRGLAAMSASRKLQAECPAVYGMSFEELRDALFKHADLDADIHESATQNQKPIAEGKLRGNWTPGNVRALPPRKRNVLKQNAINAGDQEVLDIIAAIERESAAVKKPAPAAAPAAPNAGRIMLMIDDAIGNSYPDGDPLDRLLPRLSREFGIGGDRAIAALDRAVAATKSGRDFNDYVRQVWQQHIDDSGSGDVNPW